MYTTVGSAYSYSIFYKPGKQLTNADSLSRWPLLDTPPHVPMPDDTVLLLECFKVSAVSAAQIRRCTTQDPVVAKVFQYAMQGWPAVVDDNLTASPYHPSTNGLAE